MANFSRFLFRSLASATILGMAGAGAYGIVHFGPAVVEAAQARSDAAAANAEDGESALILAQATPKQAAPTPPAPRPAAPAQAAPKQQNSGPVTTTTTRHGGWVVSCSEAGTPASKTCSANYRVVNKNNNSNIMVWLIGRNKEGKLLTEFVSLPNVQIQPGVLFTLDEGKPVKADYVECTTQSCKSRVELTPNLVRQMKATKKVKVDLTRLDGQVVQFTMDVTGIDLALGDLGA